MIEPHFVDDVILFSEHVLITVVRVVIDFDSMLVEDGPFSLALVIIELLMDVLHLFFVLSRSVFIVNSLEIGACNLRKSCRLDFFE